MCYKIIFSLCVLSVSLYGMHEDTSKPLSENKQQQIPNKLTRYTQNTLALAGPAIAISVGMLNLPPGVGIGIATGAGDYVWVNHTTQQMPAQDAIQYKKIPKYCGITSTVIGAVLGIFVCMIKNTAGSSTSDIT
ncbi:MAG TPA: hypothetical protein VGW78_06405 [Candidatus Babeliales bacterium]|jgi:hypothetical protein|nr:hypothetical protein [Candidatus Babeliales bacterium]